MEPEFSDGDSLSATAHRVWRDQLGTLYSHPADAPIGAVETFVIEVRENFQTTWWEQRETGPRPLGLQAQRAMALAKLTPAEKELLGL